MIDLFGIVLLLALLWLIRNLYFRRLVTAYRFKLYALRDQLRKRVITKLSNADSATFGFLDHSISNAIEHLDCINIYVFAGLVVKVKKTNEYKTLQEEVYQKFDTSLTDIHSEYNRILKNFLMKRFPISRLFMLVAALSIISSISFVQKTKKALRPVMRNLAIVMRLLPEEKPLPAAVRYLFI